jgi:DnaJ-class molecular chaperone
MLTSSAYEILADEDKRAKYDRMLQFGVTEYKEHYQTPDKRKTDEEGEEIEEEEEKEVYNFKDAYKMYQEFYAKEREAEGNSYTMQRVTF